MNTKVLENSFLKYFESLQRVDGSTYSYRHRSLAPVPRMYPMIYKSVAAAVPDKNTKLLAARNASTDHLLGNNSDSWNCLTIARHMLMFHEWLPYPCGYYREEQVYNWLCEQKFATVRDFYNNINMRTISLGGKYCNGNWTYYESACIRLKLRISDQVLFTSYSKREYRQINQDYNIISTHTHTSTHTSTHLYK